MRVWYPIYAVCWLLAGCIGHSAFSALEGDPWADAAPSPVPRRYSVQTGDTLYSIAWQHGLDYRRLAAANAITPPYRIYPKQILLLREQPVLAIVAQSPLTQSSAPKPARQKADNPTAVPARPTAAALSWHWPVTGRVVQTFAAKKSLSNGIDIQAKIAEPVRATAEGVVVYAGNGLKGYGNLIIIKHDERHLSAYANTALIRVEEQQLIKAKQVIADLGNDMASTVLHFEIRVDGIPVNPLHFLPKY